MLVDIGEQRSRLSRDQSSDVPAGRCLTALRVDLRLRVDRHRLIRRERIHGKEPGRVAGEAIHRHHAKPSIDAVERARRLASQQIAPQRADVAQRVGVIEDEQVVAHVAAIRPPDVIQTREDLRQGRRIESRLQEDPAERVHVARLGDAAQQRGLQGGCPAAGKRIVDRGSRCGQTLDEETRELRLEAGAIRDFVETVSGPLPSGPELVDEQRHRDAALANQRHRGLFVGPFAFPGEGTQLAEQRGCVSVRRWDACGIEIERRELAAVHQLETLN